MTRILAFTNNKGGTGKSTLCVNMAHLTAQRGRRVLLVDLTSQTTSSSLLLGTIEPLPEQETILGLLKPNPDCSIEDIVFESDKGVDVVASHIHMAQAANLLASMGSAGSYILKGHLERIRAQYDYIFIDSPGDLNALSANAIVPADQVMIPTRLNRTDFQCTEATIRFIEAMEGSRRVRVVVNMLDDRYLPGNLWAGSHTGQLYQQACQMFGDVLAGVTIPDSSDIRTAFDHNLTLMEHRPEAMAMGRIQALVEREVFSG